MEPHPIYVAAFIFSSVPVRGRTVYLYETFRLHFSMVNNPVLNRNTGKYNLPLIWDGVLFNTPELKAKNKNIKCTSPYQYHLRQVILQNNVSMRPEEAILVGWQKLIYKLPLDLST